MHIIVTESYASMGICVLPPIFSAPNRLDVTKPQRCDEYALEALNIAMNGAK